MRSCFHAWDRSLWNIACFCCEAGGRWWFAPQWRPGPEYKALGIPRTKVPDSGAEPGVGEPVCLATAAHGEMVRGLAMNPSDRFFVSAGGRSSSGLVIWRPHDEATEEQINEETKVGREDIRGAARHPSKEKEKEKEQRPARKGRRTSGSSASTAPSKECDQGWEYSRQAESVSETAFLSRLMAIAASPTGVDQHRATLATD